ncbi:MAG: nucleoside deaminase [Patescibacteria group bacterium]
MQIAIDEAEKGLRKKDGGPFGAVIVYKGKVIAKAHNQVLKNSDPTCHAEMQAIRAAAKKLKRFDLSDCEIYSSCEPCPMCLGAIHWAKMRQLYFGATRSDAAKIGFDDKFIYDVILGTAKKKQVKIIKIGRAACLKPFQKWLNLKSKTQY